MIDEKTADAAGAAAAFSRLVDIVARLRGPGGCPWDIEQSPASLRGDLIEETYECIEAIDEKDPEHIGEELGDLLFSAVNLCRYMKVEPSVALGKTNAKFTRRFQYVEQRMKETGAEMNRENLALMDRFWEEAKGMETAAGN